MLTGSGYRRLRRRCEAIASGLPLPDPFDVHALCERIATSRGKPIRLMPMSGDHDVLGVWVATDAADLIFYQQGTSRPHQEHIILHELGHLLCDHYPALLSGAEFTHLLMPGLDPEMVRRVLARTTYAAHEEQEAELLASVIRQHAYRAPSAPNPDAATDPLARVEAAFDAGRGDHRCG